MLCDVMALHIIFQETQNEENLEHDSGFFLCTNLILLKCLYLT